MSTPPYGQPPVSQSDVWPPAATGSPFEGAPANTSGQRGDVPMPIAGFKWNWGAFGLSWIWLVNHNLILWGVLLLVVPIVLGRIPIVGGLVSIAVFICNIVLGLTGHKLAWQNRRFDGGVQQYLEVETAWRNWGIALFVLGFLVVAAILYPVFATAREKAREQALHNQGVRLTAPAWSHDGVVKDRSGVATLRSASGSIVRIELRSCSLS